MKKVLLLMVAVLMISSVAMADHIGVYTDGTATACLLAPGFTSTATVVQKFSTGSSAARFKVVLPAGSSFFSFSTPYTTSGGLTTDLSVGYSPCLSGSFVVGQIVAILTPGTISVAASDLQSNIFWLDCDFIQHNGTGGHATVGASGNPQDCGEVATEPSTWGQVKALYR